MHLPRTSRLARPVASLLGLLGAPLLQAAAPLATVDQVVVPASWSEPANQTTLVIPVLANDTDPDGGPLTVVGLTQPQFGTVTHDGATVTYTPRPEYALTLGWMRSDYFSYAVRDPEGNTDSAFVCLANSPRPLVRGVTVLPHRFETLSRVFDPVNNFYDEAVIHYDADHQQQRVDITFHNPNENPLAISVFLRPSQGFSHRVTPIGPEFEEAACIQGDYTFPLQPATFPARTTGYLGRETVGRQTVTRWIVPTEFTVEIHSLATVGTNAIPVAIDSYSLSSPTSLSARLEYLDFQLRSSAELAPFLELPNDCLFDP